MNRESASLMTVNPTFHAQFWGLSRETMSTWIYVLGKFGIYYLQHLNTITTCGPWKFWTWGRIGKNISHTPNIYNKKLLFLPRRNLGFFFLSTSFREILWLSEFMLIYLNYHTIILCYGLLFSKLCGKASESSKSFATSNSMWEQFTSSPSFMSQWGGT